VAAGALDNCSGGQIGLGSVQQQAGETQLLCLSDGGGQRKVAESVAATRRCYVVADVPSVLCKERGVCSMPDARDADNLLGG